MSIHNNDTQCGKVSISNLISAFFHPRLGTKVWGGGGGGGGGGVISNIDIALS